jgi:magnesium transporter
MITENLLKDRSFSWFDVVEPKSEDFNTLSADIGLPYLLVQDMLKPEHLPKYESSQEGDFLMLRSFDPDSTKESTTVQELTRKIALYITKDRMVSVHRVELDVINNLRDKVQRNEAPKTIQGLVHQLILNMIRTYELPLTNLQDVYEDFEADVLSRKCEYLDSTRIYHFRRQLFVLKRILKQTQDALYRSRNFWEEHHSMLQDLKENIDQVYFQLDEISDSFEHLFQLHISLSDQRANDVMKVLTVFSSVLLPLNFIASFYGMNFAFIPGLHSETALRWVVAFMILVSVCAIFYFKRKGWFNSRPD